MKLYELFPNFIKLSSLERMKFLRSYRAKRALELEDHCKRKKSNRVVLSDEEKQLIKKLGITQKTLSILKDSIANERN